MALAVVVALLATVLVSLPAANWVVRQYTFESPDSVEDLHRAVFMGCNLLALLVGWAIGWVIGGRFVRAPSV